MSGNQTNKLGIPGDMTKTKKKTDPQKIQALELTDTIFNKTIINMTKKFDDPVKNFSRVLKPLKINQMEIVKLKMTPKLQLLRLRTYQMGLTKNDTPEKRISEQKRDQHKIIQLNNKQKKKLTKKKQKCPGQCGLIGCSDILYTERWQVLFPGGTHARMRACLGACRGAANLCFSRTWMFLFLSIPSSL